MIYFNERGQLVDTDDLLYRGLGGEHGGARAQAYSHKIEIPPPPAQQAPQPQQPAQGQMPQGQAQPGQQGQSQGQQGPNLPTYYDLIQSKAFADAPWEQRKQMYEQWRENIYKPYMIMGGADLKQLSYFVGQADQQFMTDFPKPENSWWRDSWDAAAQGLASATGDLAYGIGQGLNRLGWDSGGRYMHELGDKAHADADEILRNSTTGRIEDARLAAIRSRDAHGFWGTLDAGLSNIAHAPLQTAGSLVGEFAPTLVAGATTGGAGALATTAATTATQGLQQLGSVTEADMQQNLAYIQQKNATEHLGMTPQQEQEWAYQQSTSGEGTWLRDALAFGSGAVLALPVAGAAGKLAGKAFGKAATAGIEKGMTSAEIAALPQATRKALLKQGAGAVIKDSALGGAGGALNQIATNLGSADPNTQWDTNLGEGIAGGVATTAPFGVVSAAGKYRAGATRNNLIGKAKSVEAEKARKAQEAEDQAKAEQEQEQAQAQAQEQVASEAQATGVEQADAQAENTTPESRDVLEANRHTASQAEQQALQAVDTAQKARDTAQANFDSAKASGDEAKIKESEIALADADQELSQAKATAARATQSHTQARQALDKHDQPEWDKEWQGQTSDVVLADTQAQVDKAKAALLKAKAVPEKQLESGETDPFNLNNIERDQGIRQAETDLDYAQRKQDYAYKKFKVKKPQEPVATEPVSLSPTDKDYIPKKVASYGKPHGVDTTNYSALSDEDKAKIRQGMRDDPDMKPYVDAADAHGDKSDAFLDDLIANPDVKYEDNGSVLGLKPDDGGKPLAPSLHKKAKGWLNAKNATGVSTQSKTHEQRAYVAAKSIAEDLKLDSGEKANPIYKLATVEKPAEGSIAHRLQSEAQHHLETGETSEELATILQEAPRAFIEADPNVQAEILKQMKETGVTFKDYKESGFLSLKPKPQGNELAVSDIVPPALIKDVVKAYDTEIETNDRKAQRAIALVNVRKYWDKVPGATKESKGVIERYLIGDKNDTKDIAHNKILKSALKTLDGKLEVSNFNPKEFKGVNKKIVDELTAEAGRQKIKAEHKAKTEAEKNKKTADKTPMPIKVARGQTNKRLESLGLGKQLSKNQLEQRTAKYQALKKARDTAGNQGKDTYPELRDGLDTLEQTHAFEDNFNKKNKAYDDLLKTVNNEGGRTQKTDEAFEKWVSDLEGMDVEGLPEEADTAIKTRVENARAEYEELASKEANDNAAKEAEAKKQAQVQANEKEKSEKVAKENAAKPLNKTDTTKVNNAVETWTKALNDRVKSPSAKVEVGEKQLGKLTKLHETLTNGGKTTAANTVKESIDKLTKELNSLKEDIANEQANTTQETEVDPANEPLSETDTNNVNKAIDTWTKALKDTIKKPSAKVTSGETQLRKLTELQTKLTEAGKTTAAKAVQDSIDKVSNELNTLKDQIATDKAKELDLQHREKPEQFADKLIKQFENRENVPIKNQGDWLYDSYKAEEYLNNLLEGTKDSKKQAKINDKINKLTNQRKEFPSEKDEAAYNRWEKETSGKQEDVNTEAKKSDVQFSKNKRGDSRSSNQKRSNVSLSQAVDRNVNGTPIAGDALVHVSRGDIPALESVGANATEILMRGDIIEKIIKKTDKNGNPINKTSGHQVSPEVIKNLPNLLEHAIAVFKGGKHENQYLILVDETETKPASAVGYKGEVGALDKAKIGGKATVDLPLVVAVHVHPETKGVEITDVGVTGTGLIHSAYGKDYTNLAKDFSSTPMAYDPKHYAKWYADHDIAELNRKAGIPEDQPQIGAASEALSGDVQSSTNTMGNLRQTSDGRTYFPTPEELQSKGNINEFTSENQESRRKLDNETPVKDVVGLKQALPEDMHDSIDNRLELGAKGERGGIVMVENEADLPDKVSLNSDNQGIQAMYDPDTGITYIVGNNLTKEYAEGVVLHEAIHGNPNGKVESTAYEMVQNAQSMEGEVGDFMRSVKDRMDQSGVSHMSDEAAPYIVEEAVVRGRSQGFSVLDGKFMNWVDNVFGKTVGDFMRDVVARFRAWRIDKGADYTPTVDDMVAYARRSQKLMAKGLASGQGKTHNFSLRTDAIGVVKRKLGEKLSTTKPATDFEDRMSLAYGNARPTVYHGFLHTLKRVGEEVHRLFVDSYSALEKYNPVLHQKLESGVALKNSLMSTLDKQYFEPYTKQLAHAAGKIRKKLHAYKNITAAELSEHVGNYALAKYVADGANRIQAEKLTYAKEGIKEQYETQRNAMGAEAAYASNTVDDLTDTQRQSISELVDKEITSDMDIREVQELLRGKVNSKLVKDAQALYDDFTTQTRQIDTQLETYKKYDAMDFAGQDAQKALRESGYKPIGGMTTGMAKRMLKAYENHPLIGDIKELYKPLMTLNKEIIRLGDEYGIFSDADRQARDGLDSYVPTTGDPKASLQENLVDNHLITMEDFANRIDNHIGYGVGINNTNLFKVRQGRTSLADPADKAIIDRMHLVLNQIATKQFKDGAVEHALNLINPELAKKFQEGQLTAEELNSALQSKRDPDSGVPDIEILSGRGQSYADNDINAQVMVQGPEGTHRQTVRIRFNNEQVAKAVKHQDTARLGPVGQVISTLTRWQQRMIVQMDWAFAPKSLIRDIPESLSYIISNYDFKDEHGNPINLSFSRSVLGAAALVKQRLGFATKEQRANNAVWQAAIHRNFLNTKDGRLLKEFLLSKDGSGISTQASILSSTMNARGRALNRYDGTLKGKLAQASDALTAWSEFFELQGKFAIYKLLREKGVSATDARNAILDSMNFNRKGAATGGMRAFYFFLNPSIQGAHNAFKSLRSDWRRWQNLGDGRLTWSAIKTSARAGKIMAMYATMATIAQSMAGAMAGTDEYDDVLGNYYERIPVGQRMKSISIPSPFGEGEFINIPISFGINAIGWGAGQIINDYARGKLSAADAGGMMTRLVSGELTGLPISNVDPTRQPVEFIARSVLPPGMTGFVDVATGKNRWGTDLNDPYLSDTQTRASQGRQSTESYWHDLANFVQENTGIDYTPEEMRALFTGTFPAPIWRIMKGVDAIGEDNTKAMINILGGGSFYTQGAPNALAAEYYNRRLEYDDKIKELNKRLPYTGDSAESAQDMQTRAIHAGFSADDAYAMALITQARRDARGADRHVKEMVWYNTLQNLPKR